MPEGTKRPPFMTDPAHLTALAGQKYVVMRVGGELERLFRDTQRLLRERLVGLPVGYPNTGHVTLRGFPSGTDHIKVTGVLNAWSRETAPLSIATERLGHFGPPHQTIILRVRRTEDLVRAYARLAKLADQAGLPALPEGGFPVERWVFHISLAYCRALPEDDWARVVAMVGDLPVPSTCHLAEDAELVCFDDEGEHQAVYRLSDAAPA